MFFYVSFFQEEVEGLQWGRPGPGGAYWRNSALTGQNFFDKMVNRINFFLFIHSMKNSYLGMVWVC